MYSQSEAADNLVAAAIKKAQSGFLRLLILSFMAGIIIAFSGVISNTAGHSITSASIQRILIGATFAVGLPTVILMGAELFTGNCLMITAVLKKKITVAKMLRNWAIVYIGNFLGSMFVAVLVVYSQQLNYSANGLAAFTIKVALSKSTATVQHSLFTGILCNILVCSGVFMAMCAKDVAGKIIASYIPVFVFVSVGFEHSIANMYFCIAGLLAKSNPAYLSKAVEMGIDVSRLSWSSFFSSLFLATAGNIIGGALIIGVYIWHCHQGVKQ